MSTTLTYDPLDPTVQADPYPHYAQLRAEAPVHHVEPLGMWVVSRHADCLAVARSPQLFSTRAAIAALRDPRIPAGVRAVGNPAFAEHRHLLAADPPEHTIMRRMVNRGFTPAVVRSWEPRLRQIAEDQVRTLLDRAEEGTADFVRDVATAIPIRVIAEVLGVPAGSRDDFKRWSLGIVESLKPVESIDFDALERADRELRAFFAEVIEERRAHPTDDLVSLLVASNETSAEEPLSADELVELCAFLLVAGNETTSDILGSWMDVLLDRPDVLDALRADRALIGPSFEEALRFDAPALLFVRSLREPADVGGVALPAGAVVGLLHGSANHDEDQWGADAERYVLERRPKDHLAFGHGAHLCLGAPLVRLETAVVAEVLLDRIAHIERAGPTVRTRSFLRRGCLSLPVVLGPATESGPPSGGARTHSTDRAVRAGRGGPRPPAGPGPANRGRGWR